MIVTFTQRSQIEKNYIPIYFKIFYNKINLFNVLSNDIFSLINK